jgi:phage terminase large subunit-like protein
VQLMDIINNMLDEDVERGIYIAARSGNVTAGMFWVLNRQPKKWKDTKKIVIERNETVSVEIVHSVKQSALELLRAAGVQALQPGGALDIVDAEVVGES